MVSGLFKRSLIFSVKNHISGSSEVCEITHGNGTNYRVQIESSICTKNLLPHAGQEERRSKTYGSLNDVISDLYCCKPLQKRCIVIRYSAITGSICISTTVDANFFAPTLKQRFSCS